MIKVLKASAGTGKTYRLSLEYVASLLEGKNFAEIAVMTFTRKATAEIRDRIFAHLTDLVKDGQESEVYSSLLAIYPGLNLDRKLLTEVRKKMLLNKDQINIYTIDSFINKIFRKAIAPYLDIYQYEIIEDERNEEIIAEVFKRILDKPEDFQLMENFLRENTERNIDKYISLIKKVLNNRWKFMVMDYTTRSKLDVENIAVHLDRCLDILKEVADERGEVFNEDYFIRDYRGIMNNYQQLQETQEKERLIADRMNLFFKKSFWNGNKLRRKSLADLKENLEQQYEKFRTNLACYIYNEEIIPYEQQVHDFSSRIFTIYDRIKFRQKAFTHSDISNYCYKYFFDNELNLVTGDRVSEYFYDLLGTEVKSLFIDEFQDTSILQWKILKPLIDSSDHVIAVGDEKQSIYGWRGGEKELFASLEEILPGESETLEICYRSQLQIINFVNRFFSNLEEDWEYNRVTNLTSKNKGYVEVMVGGEAAKINTGTRTFQNKSEEEKEYCQRINRKLNENLKKEIAGCIEERIEDYKNTAVLARSNSELEEIAEELDKRNIPYILESQDSLVAHEAVKPLYFLLRYLYSGDYFQLIRFLRSDLVGVSNSILKYLLTAKTEVEAFLRKGEKELEFDDLSRLLAEIKSLRELSYGELTDYIINRTGVLDLFADNTGALKNLYYFFKLMRGFDSLAEFMEYLEENRDSDRLKQAGVRAADAVKLLTIHKAKGLSFPTEFFYWKPGNGSRHYGEMEIYIDFDREYRQVEDYLLTNSKYRRILEYLNIDFARKDERRALMEEINNVYVALTRAAENLFFYIESPRQLKDAGEGRYWAGSSYEFYEQAILAGAEVRDLTELIEPETRGSLAQKPELKGEQEVKLPDLSGYFQAEDISEATLIEYDKNRDFNRKLEGNFRRLEGLAVHYYLEHVKYNRPQECEYARAAVLAKFGNILGPERLDDIFSRVKCFVSNNPQFFDESRVIFTEYRLRGNNIEKNYRIDRLLVDKENREIEIIDYKTGALREGTQLEKYRELLKQKVDSHYSISTRFVNV